MESETKQKMSVIVELSQEEALWLKILVQNPIRNDESAEDREMREKFFDALPNFPKLLP